MPTSPRGKWQDQHASRDDVRVVEECDALVRRTLLELSRLPAEHPVVGKARDRLRDLRPLLEEAYAALGRIEDNGGLTDRELARRRAFRMLLDLAAGASEGWPGRKPGPRRPRCSAIPPMRRGTEE